MSWESLDLITNRDDEAKQASDIATLYFTCFGTDVGNRVLENMIEAFMTKPVVRSGEDAYAQGIRQGRQDVVMQIIQQIEFAKDPKNFEPKKSLAKWIKKILLKDKVV
jgi:hypothetical protein